MSARDQEDSQDDTDLSAHLKPSTSSSIFGLAVPKPYLPFHSAHTLQEEDTSTRIQLPSTANRRLAQVQYPDTERLYVAVGSMPECAIYDVAEKSTPIVTFVQPTRLEPFESMIFGLLPMSLSQLSTGLAIGDCKGHLWLFDADSGELVTELPLPPYPLYSLAKMKVGEQSTGVLLAGGKGRTFSRSSGEIVMYDLDHGSKVWSLTGLPVHTRAVQAIEVFGNRVGQNVFFSGSETIRGNAGANVACWDQRTFSRTPVWSTYAGGSCFSLLCASDANLLLVGASQGVSCIDLRVPDSANFLFQDTPRMPYVVCLDRLDEKTFLAGSEQGGLKKFRSDDGGSPPPVGMDIGGGGGRSSLTTQEGIYDICVFRESLDEFKERHQTFARADEEERIRFLLQKCFDDENSRLRGVILKDVALGSSDPTMEVGPRCVLFVSRRHPEAELARKLHERMKEQFSRVARRKKNVVRTYVPSRRPQFRVYQPMTETTVAQTTTTMNSPPGSRSDAVGRVAAGGGSSQATTSAEGQASGRSVSSQQIRSSVDRRPAPASEGTIPVVDEKKCLIQ